MSRTSSDAPLFPEPHFEPYHKTHEDEIPPQWIFERDGKKHDHFCWWPFPHFLYHLFCVIAFGYASLHEVWKVSHPKCSPELWERRKDLMRERIQHINIMAGLLLTAMTAFCTTVPPDNAILPYTKPGSYLILLVSIGFSLGGLIVGSVIVFVVPKAKIQWFNETFMGSRFRIWTTMILLSYPFIAAGISTCAAFSGLLIAASYSEVKLVKVACYFLVAPHMLCGTAFLWIVCVRPPKTGIEKDYEAGGAS